MLTIDLTSDGITDPIFADMPATQQALQWHSVQVQTPPPEAVVLASSALCANQAMRVGERAWSMQYHVEVEADTVTTWAQVPAYREALASTLGEQALPELQKFNLLGRLATLFLLETILITN